MQKLSRPGGNYHDDEFQKEEKEFFRLSAISTANAFDTDAVVRYVDTQQSTILNNYPAKWLSASFSEQYQQAMVIRWRETQTMLYLHTKFYPSRGDSRKVQGLRDNAFKRFRRILDRQQFELPRPYGVHGNYDQDIHTLIRQLEWIRDYRIEKFPESISEKEIEQARTFHFKMRNLLKQWKRYYINGQATTTLEGKRQQERLARTYTSEVDGTTVEDVPDLGEPTNRTKASRRREKRLAERNAKKTNFVAEEPEIPALVKAFETFQRQPLGGFDTFMATVRWPTEKPTPTSKITQKNPNTFKVDLPSS